MRSNFGTFVAVVSLLGILPAPAGAEARVRECGAFIVSGALPDHCVRAIGSEDWQPVVLSPCPNGAPLEFEWKVFDTGNGEHFIRTLLRPNETRRMEVRGWSHEEGGLIQIWGANYFGADGNQKWITDPADAGQFRLRVVDGGKCLTAAGSEHQLVQRTCDPGDPNQRWSFRTVVNVCEPGRE